MRGFWWIRVERYSLMLLAKLSLRMMRCTSGEHSERIHCSLSGGISAADDDDRFAGAEARFDGGGCVINAGHFVIGSVFGGEFSPFHAGGDEDDLGADVLVTVGVDGVIFVADLQSLGGDGRDEEAPNLYICSALRIPSSAPERPDGKPMKFSIIDEPEACPPGPRRSRTTVLTASDDAYTAAAMPAGPPPMIARS